jgi:hypothetical protein
MYALPDNFDAAVFVGRMLEQVSFTTNTVAFDFDRGVSITVLGEVWHEGRDDRGDRWLDVNAVPVRQSRLMHLLGQEVASGSVDGRATLVLEFGSEHTLRLVADAAQYECYHLRIGDDLIVV